MSEIGKVGPPQYETGAFDLYREELDHHDPNAPAKGIALEYARICEFSHAALLMLNIAVRGYDPRIDGKKYEYQMRLAYLLEDEGKRLATSLELPEVVEAQGGEHLFLEMLYDLRHGATAAHIAEANLARQQYMRSLRLACLGSMTIGAYIASQGDTANRAERQAGELDLARMEELRARYHGHDALD